jgi:hypothetical protein
VFGGTFLLYGLLFNQHNEAWIKQSRILSHLIYEPIYMYIILAYLLAVSGGAGALLYFLPSKSLPKASEEGKITMPNEGSKSGLLLFKDRVSFDNWINDVNFKLGYPKHSRSAKTDEVRNDVTGTLTYADPKAHPDKNDKRIVCRIKEEDIAAFINDAAQKKYNFTRISFREAEEIGFFSDRIDLKNEEIKEFKIGTLAKFIDNYEEESQKAFTSDTGISFDLFIKISFMSENRNKYILDFTSGLLNQNRLSIFLDKQNNLCFRIIDNQKQSYIMNVGNTNIQDFMYLHCKYHEDTKLLTMLINGKEIGRFLLPKGIEFILDSYKITIGGNLNGEYNCAFTLLYLSALKVDNGKAYILTRLNPSKAENVFKTDDGRVSHIKSE